MSASGNWDWRVDRGALTEELAARLRTITELYGRLPKTAASDSDSVATVP